MNTCDDDLDNFESYLKDDIPKDFGDLVGDVYFLMNKGELLLTCKFCEEYFLSTAKFLNHLHDLHLFIKPPIDHKTVLSNKVDTECIDEHMHAGSKDECLELNKSLELKDHLNLIIPQLNTDLIQNCSLVPEQTFQEHPAEPSINLIKSISDSSSFLKYSEEQEPKDFVTSSENFNEYQQNSDLPTTLISNYQEEPNIVFNGNIHQALPSYNHIFQNNDRINGSPIVSVLERVGAQHYDTINNEINKEAMEPIIGTQEGQELVSNDAILYNNISTSDLYIRYNEEDGTYDLINCSANLLQTPVIPVMNQEPNNDSIPLMTPDYNLVETEVATIPNNIFVDGNIDETPLIDRSEDIDMNSIDNESDNIYPTFDDFSDIRNVESYQDLIKFKNNSEPVDDNKTEKPSNPVALNIKWQEQKNEGYLESFQNFLKCDRRIETNEKLIESIKLRNDKQRNKNFENNKTSVSLNNSSPHEKIEKKLHCNMCSSSRTFSSERNLAKHKRSLHRIFPKTTLNKMDETYEELTINGCSKPIANNCNSTKHKNNHNDCEESLLNNNCGNNEQKNALEVNSISEYSNHSPDTTETNSPSKYLNHSNLACLNNAYYDMQTDEVVTEVIIDNNQLNLDYSDFTIPLESEEQSNIDLNVT